MKSSCGKHIGEDPSQQPPDWWNSTGPCRSRSVWIRACAVAVAMTCSATVSSIPANSPLEESKLVGRVAHQQVLGLLVMIQHHLVRFAADARLLVATER